MLEAVPKHWFSWDFAILDGPRHVADLDVSWWREKGQLTVAGQVCQVTREGLLGAFVLESAGVVLARAEKPSAFFRRFTIEQAGRRYTLRAASFFTRAMQLLDGETVVGHLAPAGFFTRRARVDLPERLPLPVRVFVIWLAILLWKREAESAGD